MNDYIAVRISVEPASEAACDLMADSLGAEGFESFTFGDGGETPGATMTAYVRKEAFDPESMARAASDVGAPWIFKWEYDEIEGRDWNAEWEKNYFKPIVIGNRCVVHSSFHTDVPAAEHDITIDPKMAFGTGHHATTSLVIEALLESDISSKRVVDMGTGSGILAILCAKLGAAHIDAIEIDGFAYTNAIENIGLNRCADKITAVNGDASALKGISEQADIFIANINRNIITGDIDAYAAALKPGGIMLLSGFYEEDIPVVAEAASTHGLSTVSHSTRERWTCLHLIKQQR